MAIAGKINVTMSPTRLTFSRHPMRRVAWALQFPP